MFRAFVHGARLAVKCWPLALALWIINALLGIALGCAAGYWLAIALDGSFATHGLLKDLDPNVLIDLYFHHFSSFRILVFIVALTAVAYVLLWCWLHGAVILSAQSGGALRVREALHRGWELSFTMFELFLIAAAILLAFSILLWALLRPLILWTMESGSEVLPAAIAAGGGVLWLLGFILLVAIHDHARIRACSAGGSSVASYRWAARFVVRGGEPAYLLALALNLTALAVWVLYASVAIQIPTSNSAGVAGALVWGQLLVYSRMALRIWFFAAQSDLQSPA